MGVCVLFLGNSSAELVEKNNYCIWLFTGEWSHHLSMKALPVDSNSLSACMEESSLSVVLARPGSVVIMRGIGCLILHESK